MYIWAVSNIKTDTWNFFFFLFLTSIYSRRINQLPECQALCQTLGKGYGAKPRGASCCHRVFWLVDLTKGQVHVPGWPKLVWGGVGWTVDGFLGRENFLCKGSVMWGSKVVQVPRRRSEWRIPERTQAAEVGGEETPVGTKHSDIDLYPII